MTRLEITENTRAAFFRDSVKKHINVEVIPKLKSNFRNLNFYIGGITTGGYGHTGIEFLTSTRYSMYINNNPRTTAAEEYFDMEYLKHAKFMRFSIAMNGAHNASESATVNLFVRMTKRDGTLATIEKPFLISELLTTENSMHSITIQDKVTETMEGDRIELAEIKEVNAFLIGYPSEDCVLTYGYSRFMLQLFMDEPGSAGMADYTKPYTQQGIDPEEVIIIGDRISDFTEEEIGFEDFQITESLCSGDKVKFGLCEAGICEFSIYNRTEDINEAEIAPYIQAEGTSERIPLGRYKVNSIKKSNMHRTLKRKITAYDALADLEENAFNWYSFYMYGRNTEDYERSFGYEFPRQIYSSYFNLAKYLGIEKRSNYTEQTMQTRSTGAYKLFYDTPELGQGRIRLRYNAVEVDTTGKEIFCVDLSRQMDDESVLSYMDRYVEFIDAAGRGLINCEVLVLEFDEDDNFINRYAVDSGDYFMTSPEAAYIRIYYLAKAHNNEGNPYENEITINEFGTVSKITNTVDLTNGWIRLLYYNYYTLEIYKIDTTVTARDIIRSLIEVCGAFFKLDRNGKTKFLYMTKAGLYPSNDLYPEDTLFPLATSGTTATTEDYMSMECEDYAVTNYGRIQIIKQDQDNANRNVVQWEYKGSEQRNTYLIEDNIFYSNPELEYEFDAMPEVYEMLVNMYERISGLGYTPHTTQSRGLPFAETGDRIIVLTETGGIETFIFRRTLHGIHSLRDTYEAEGPRWNRPVAEYNYKTN